MSFVAAKPITPLDPDAPDINDAGAVVELGAWWPTIELADLRRALRLNGHVTTERLHHAASEALVHVCEQLLAWQMAQIEQGETAMASIAAHQINGESVLVFRFRRAVYCIAKALLTEGYRDIDSTRHGDEHAAALSEQIDVLWRDARWAINDIRGARRSLAQLV
ncbi:MAG: head completion/stabilization protein [Aeromonas sp.]